MSCRILNGAPVAAEIDKRTAELTARLSARGVMPTLAIVRVGERDSDLAYERAVVRRCGALGICVRLAALTSEAGQTELMDSVRALNDDHSVHGIILLRPLPDGLDALAACAAISPEKDVDCFHPQNVGAVVTGGSVFLPCTPAGIVEMLHHEKIETAGKNCVIVGRSNIVGKPMAMLMLRENSTVTVCHSKTENLASFTSNADVLIAAVGRAKMITADMVKPGAAVIDVGMNRDENGKLCGDVDFESVSKIAGAITPVPGGVGPMTVALLMRNTAEAAAHQNNIG